MNIYERLGMKAAFFRDPLFTFAGAEVTLEKVIVFSLVLIIGWLISHAIQRAVNKAFSIRGVHDEGTVGVAQRLLHYVILAVAIAIAMELVGISLDSLFAAGAVFAIGLGFAMQNIVQNFVSGIILLTERTIKPGDVLEIDGLFVRVRHMGIRATICRTLDEEEIIVPNASIVQSTVTNYTLQDSFYRLRASVGVVYGSDMKLVKRTLESVAEACDWRDHGNQPVVMLTEFSDSSVVFEISVWITDPWSMRRAKSDLNEAIWWALKEQGIVIAFPQLDLHLDPEVVKVLRGPGAVD